MVEMMDLLLNSNLSTAATAYIWMQVIGGAVALVFGIIVFIKIISRMR